MKTAFAWILLPAALACSAAEPPATWQEANRRSSELIRKNGPGDEAADLAKLAFDLYPQQARTYSPENHAQLLLNLLAVRADAAGHDKAQREIDAGVEALAKHAGPKSPLLVDVWLEAAKVTSNEGNYRKAAEQADAVWGAYDARAIDVHVKWAHELRSSKEYGWTQAKFKAARERAAKAGEGSVLVSRIDLSLAKLEKEYGHVESAIRSYGALIDRLEKLSDPEGDLVLEAAYAQLEFIYDEKGNAEDAARMRERRTQRIARAPAGLVPLLRISPVYPRRALSRRIEGSVDLLVTLRPDGTVEGATVVRSEPPGVFDQAALDSVRQWKFKPKLVDGQPVASRGSQRIEFRMR